MTTTKNDFTADGIWRDLVAADATLSGVEVLIQNKGPSRVHVDFGGAAPAAGTNSGPFLEPGVATTGNSTAIWVRAPAGVAVLAVELR